MKKKFILLIIILIVIFSLAGCGKKISTIDLESKGFTLTVTYNCLGGKIQDQEIRVIYTKEGSYLLEPSGSTNLVAPIKLGYILEGWYTSYTLINEELGDIDDNRQFNENEKWNFDIDKMGSESIILYAYWSNQKTVTWKYNNGKSDIIWKVNSGTLINRPSVEPIKTDYTFLDYYADEALTIKWDFDKNTVSGTNSNINIYAGWIEGIYNRINKVSDLVDKTNDKSKLLSNGKYILGQNLDLEGAAFIPSCASYRTCFTGIFLGNGYSISNYIININSIAPAGASYGLFGYIDNALITNLTIKNCTFIILSTSTKQINLGILSGVAQNNSIVSGCNVSGNVYNQNDSSSIGLIYAGGIIGYLKGTSNINNCYSNIIMDISNTGGNKSGGLIGRGEALNSIDNCLINSSINIESGTAGGIAGSFLGTISRCVLIDDIDDSATMYDGINISNDELLILEASEINEKDAIITAWLNGSQFIGSNEYVEGSETNNVDINIDGINDVTMWKYNEDELPSLWYSNN